MALSDPRAAVLSPEQEREAAAKALRREMSSTRTAKFPNTLAAMRRKKEEDRIERLRAEEEARVVIDEEEEKLRQIERVRVLEAAHRSITENTDKMKMLRSLRLASYVDDVRQAQLAMAERRKKAAAEDEEAAFQRLLLRIKAGDERDAAEAEARAAQRKAVAIGQKAQLADFLRRRMEEMEATRLEGRRIAEKAAADAAADAAERERRKAAVIAANKEMAAINAHLHTLKEEGRAAAAAEEERIAAYAEAKAREAETKAGIIRARREEAARKARLIAERVEKELATRVHGEEARVAAAVAEAEARADALEQHRRACQRQMRSDIEAHRLAQSRRAEAEAAEAARTSALEGARFAANIKALEDMEARDAAERRERARFLREYHLAQMADRARMYGEASEGDRAAATAAGAAAAGKDASSEMSAAFAAAAEALVAEEAARGKRTLAVQRAVARSRKDPLIAATQLM